MPKLTVVISQGQSANPAKRQLEEELVGALLFERGVEVTVVPHLYDLKPDGTALLALEGITGDMVVLSWLFPRAAHWILDRHGIRGHEGKTLLVPENEDEDEDEEPVENETAAAVPPRELPNRRIYCLDLREPGKVPAYVQEIKRILAESSVQTVDLLGMLGAPAASGGNGSGNGDSIRGLTPPARQEDHSPLTTHHSPIRIDEEPDRRWYPVIDFSRCTNCLECLDFCLFGVYGVEKFDRILVEQPDNCRKGCPACSRVCPANAIIFPQHKSPAIAGAAGEAAGAFKIDLSKLFGAPNEDPLQTAVRERDEQLVLAGRDAVGVSVGIPKRQDGKSQGPKDELDSLMDRLDELDL
jgi:NAD-dependent dihydropyrimidine dehydrogenase PreA subunit